MAALHDTVGAHGDAFDLLRSVEFLVGPRGEIATHSIRVSRIRTQAGRAAGFASVPYTEGQGTIRYLRGWVIPQGQVARAVEVGEVADIALGASELHGEGRARVITLEDRVTPGDVLVIESLLDDRPPFLQWDHAVSVDRPARRVELGVSLPADWKLTTRAIRGIDRPRASLMSAESDHWTFADVPARDSMPERRDSIPNWLAFSAQPPSKIAARMFANWEEVGDWLAGLSKRDRVEAKVQAFADQFRRDRAGPEQPLRALMETVQRIRYVSIQTGIGRGGGYRPRPARLVLERGFGDCKDKANLLCEAARAMGFRAWLVAVNSQGRDRVLEEWPTPQQFDHCIAAVEAPDGLDAPAISSIEPLGRLLFLDPTDPDTPFGEIPQSEQGGLALIIDSGGSRLRRLPDAGALGMRSNWDAVGTLGSNGTIAARVAHRSEGEAASRARRAHRQLGDRGTVDALLRGLMRDQPGARFDSIGLSSSPESGPWRADFAWMNPRQAERLPDGRLLLRLPRWPTPDLWSSVDAGKRAEMEGMTLTERFALRLPSGFRVDGLPSDSTVLESGLELRVRARMSADSLVIDRTWRRERRGLAESSEPAAEGRMGAILRFAERSWVVRAPDSAGRP